LLKQSPLTDEELAYIRWRVWEPLRRNKDYINEYATLKVAYFLDFNDRDAFCKKWKLSRSIDPEAEFSQLKDAPNPWMVNPFREHFVPFFDHAAFVPLDRWIEDDKWLILWVDRRASKNQIEKAIKKELDEWWSKAWVNFYQKCHRREKSAESIRVRNVLDNFIGVLINLEAQRTTEIEPGLKKILKKHVGYRTGKHIPRLHAEKWSEAFEVYDHINKGWSFEDLAIKKYRDKKTIHKQYKRAYESIYPETIFKKRGDKPHIVKDFLRPTISEPIDRFGEIEQHDIVSREYLNDGDCPHCKRSLCVRHMRKADHYVCIECGKEQKTGMLYRELMKV
jgi:uncharacterized protein YutD